MTGPNTLNSSVFRQLREDIVAGRLKPGERLLSSALSRRYDTGGSPVREALMRLEAEGLVTLQENKGFRVACVSHEELIDLTATRVEIEGTALRWAIEKGGMEWEVNLVGAMHRLASVTKGPSDAPFERNVDWLAYHRAFHRTLVSGCNSAHLLDIFERLFDQGERYVALSIAREGEARDHLAEHEALAQAALNRDANRIVSLNTDHIRRTTEKLILLSVV